MCMTIRDAAKAIGYPASTVANAVLGNGHISLEKAEVIRTKLIEIGFDRPFKEQPIKEGKHWCTEKEIAEMQRMYNTRLSVQEIADTMGIHANTVLHHIDCSRRKQIDKETAEYMRSLGFSNAQIAKRLGVSHPYVITLMGRQSEEMSRNNRTAGVHAALVKRNARRENHMIARREESNKIVLAYNEHKAKVKQLRLQLESLEQEDKELRREAKKALKWATVEIA